MTAAAQKVMSLAKPLSQMKAIMGNKNKSFLHTDRLPFSPLFLSSNTLRGKWAVFNLPGPGPACNLMSGSFPRHLLTSNLQCKHLPLNSPSPLVKMMPLSGWGCEDLYSWCKGVSDQCGVWCSWAGCGAYGRDTCIPVPQHHTKAARACSYFPKWPVKGNTNQNFRVFTGKLSFVIWKNTSFSKLLLIWWKGNIMRLFSLPDLIREKWGVSEPMPGCPALASH